MGGPLWIILHEITGLLVCPEHIDELAASILRVLTDKDLSARLSGNAYAEYSKRFDQSKETDSVQSIYNSLKREI